MLKCFIASAFEREDVDLIYDQVILPVLKKHSIKALRVDRVEHNDDIDDKIFSLISESDFCIADLTYSRPSVYYEAGFITGSGKPVIYLVRNDHFKHKEDDHYGILKVHFDLQMKNIIPWNQSNITIRNKIEKRILKVIKPILKIKNDIKKSRKEEIEFSKLSQSKKQIQLLSTAKLMTKKSKFIMPESYSYYGNPNSTFFGFNKSKTLIISVVPTLTKKMLDDFRFRLSSDYDYFQVSKIKELHLVIISLKSVPDSRVTETLPFFDKETNFIYKTNYKRAGFEILFYIHVIDKIKSISDFENKFSDSVNII